MIKPSVLPIRGYEGSYLIFDDGRVFSVPRTVRTMKRPGSKEEATRKVKARELKQFMRNGLRTVHLSGGNASLRKHHTVASLVFDHFGKTLPPPATYVSRFPREPGFDGYDVWETLPGPVESIEMGEEAWT
jgi:hypothetical protein